MSGPPPAPWTDPMLIGAETLWRRGARHADMVLQIGAGQVTDIRPANGDTPDIAAFIVTSPLTDLQVNGGGGIMVNSDPSPDGLRAVAAAHRTRGTGTILPTVITDAHEVMEAAGNAALAVMGEPGIGGLHIEGPHIAPERRGTHKTDYIRPLDEKTVHLVERLRAGGLPVMVTLAPELAEAALIARLVQSGAVISAGHSTATAEQTEAALAQGISCITHLYNAMPPMTSRAPGLLGAGLNSHAYAGIIVDGIHVSWDMVRVALRARPHPGLMFAVSDAMATVGGPDHFTLYGQTIRVQDGALINAEGSLAGAHIDLVQSFGNLVGEVGVPLTEAIPMVTDTPRRVMGLPAAEIEIGTPVTDLLALSHRFDIMDLI